VLERLAAQATGVNTRADRHSALPSTAPVGILRVHRNGVREKDRMFLVQATAGTPARGRLPRVLAAWRVGPTGAGPRSHASAPRFATQKA
jgi:hypothetical protein